MTLSGSPPAQARASDPALVLRLILRRWWLVLAGGLIGLSLGALGGGGAVRFPVTMTGSALTSDAGEGEDIVTLKSNYHVQVTLGGGLSKVPDFCEEIAPLVTRYTFARDICVRFTRALHGDASGVRGAAMLPAISQPTERS